MNLPLPPGTRCGASVLAVLILIFLGSPARGVTPPGLVFEAEDIAAPVAAWLKDAHQPDRWTLWTKEQDIAKKRSRGAVLASPAVARDRAMPEEGAPPLHCVVKLQPGHYEVHVSAPGRPLAYAPDGRNWRRYEGGELHLGIQDCRSGRFEFWIDDRFAHPPENPGPGYFDYVRFTPVSPLALAVRAIPPWVGLDEDVTREGGGWIVAAQDCERQGFEPDGPRGLKGPGNGGWLAWTSDCEGDFHFGVKMVDDADGVEDLRVCIGGKEVAQCLGSRNDNRRVVFVSKEPLSLRRGDRFELVTHSPVGLYRIDRLLFSGKPIEPPPLRIENLTVWFPRPGTAHVCWTSSRPVATGRLVFGTGNALDQSLQGSPVPGRNHRVILSGLDPARECRARVETADSEGMPCVSELVVFRPVPPAPPAMANWAVELTVAEPTEQARHDWPVTGGVPFARGKLARVEDLRLVDSAGKPVLLQAEPFVRWPDGSVKVAVLTFAASTCAGEPARYRLEAKPAEVGEAMAAPAPVIALSGDESGWKIRGTGQHFDLSRNGPSFGSLRLRTGDGADLICGAPKAVECEKNGPVRGVVRWSGRFFDAAGQASDWAYLIRAELFAGRSALALDVAVWPDAREPVWREVVSLELQVPGEAGENQRGSLNGGAFEALPPEGISVLQETESRAQLRKGTRTESAGRALGVASVCAGKTRVTAVVPDFWQTYPNALAIGREGLRIGLLPELRPDLYRQEKPLEALRLFGWCREGRYVFKRGQPLRKRVILRYDAPGDAVDPALLACWDNAPLLLQAPAAHLCSSGLFSRPLFSRTEGIWDSYERYFEKGFAELDADREKWRTWGWMHHGDWFGERLLNYGNSEYDLAWTMGLQWGRTAARRYFERGLQMARHHSSVDTLRGEFAADFNGLVYEHSFNHVGIELAPDDPRRADPLMGKYLDEFGAMLGGAIDRQGHIYQAGNWLYAALTGDEWLRETAERVCANQAEKLTPAFDFGIERAGGWPLINMVMAYHFSGDPYYLNAARLMVERTLLRQDPVSGGWLHWHAGGESGGETGMGGKAFAVGILGHGLLRYLEQEPAPRPDVEKMLVRGADFLREHCWVPGQGFRYISHLAYHRDRPRRGSVELLNAELVAFAYEKTRDLKYLEFFREMMEGRLDGSPGGNGKGFSQALRQTVYGLDRVRSFEVTDGPVAARSALP